MKQIKNIDYRTLTARQLIKELDKTIIGQEQAKQSLANVVVNRLRLNLHNDKKSVISKNVLLYGPSGVGKTLVLKTISKFLQMPFLHISALSLFEDPVSTSIPNIMNKLINIVMKQRKDYWKEKYYQNALTLATDKVVELIYSLTNEKMEIIREKLMNKEYDKGILIPINTDAASMTMHIPVSEAIALMTEKELSNLLTSHDFGYEAMQEAEQCSIISLDDVDKLCVNPVNSMNLEYVQKLEVAQRRLIKLLEGTTILTEHGSMETHSLIFICSGTFAGSSVNYLIPELQAHLTARVGLNSLTKYEFLLILEDLEDSVLKQYVNLCKTYDVDVEFTGNSLKLLAELACNLNEKEQNIGIRRLNIMLEELFKNILVNIEDYFKQTIHIDENYIKALFEKPEPQIDYQKYVL